MSQVVNLEKCIDSLEGSVECLGSSVKHLDDATRDVARLQRVMATDKVFGVVPMSDLENAKRHLQHETHPQIDAMVSKVERAVGRLQRRKNNLAGKVDLQQVRIESARTTTTTATRVSKGTVPEHKLTRLKILQNKKERLKFSLSKLNLQQQHARLSMIPSLPPQ